MNRAGALLTVLLCGCANASGRVDSLLQTGEDGLIVDPQRQALQLIDEPSRHDCGARAPHFDADGIFFVTTGWEL